jgi:hypothetical protein
MALPAIFGPTWEDSVANWCLGSEPAQGRQTAETALSELLRIWPERLAAMVAGNSGGLVVVSPAIENGIVLSACSALKGFEKVLHRLKSGERAAYTELLFAARLVKGGFQPVLEPPQGDGFLDTCVPTEAGGVYCEVIAPETSDAIEEVKTAASVLAATLRDQNKGRRVEVLLSVDIDDQISTEVADAVKTHDESDEIWNLAATAQVSKRVIGDDANIGPTIPSPKGVAIIGAAKCSIDGGLRTAGIVRVPVTDSRAKRLLYGESHHFSREEMNLLVMDVTRVISSTKAWSQMIERCLQPGQNRRFGAIVLFSTGMTGEKMAPLQDWNVVRNRYARKPVPESLLTKIVAPD